MAQTINVDISTRGAPPVAYTHQGDTDRTFLVNVFENGAEFGVAGFTVKVAAILPGDNGYTVITGSDMVSATKTTTGTNQLMFTPSAQYTARSGRGILTLIMTTNTGTPATLRPINIDFRIQKSADGEDVIAGASDFPEGLEEIAEQVFQEYLSTYLPPVAPSSSADANKAASAKLTGQELDNLKSDLSDIDNDIGIKHIEIPLGMELGGFNENGVTITSATRARTSYFLPVDMACPTIVFPKDTKHRILYYDGYYDGRLQEMSDWSTSEEDTLSFPTRAKNGSRYAFKLLVAYTDDRTISDGNIPQPFIKYTTNEKSGTKCVKGYYFVTNSVGYVSDYNASNYYISAIIPVEPNTEYRANKFRNTIFLDANLQTKRVLGATQIENNKITTESDEYYVAYCWKDTDTQTPFFAKATSYIAGYTIDNLVSTPLKGKNLSLLGDSISAYTGTIPSGNDVYYTGSNSGMDSPSQMWWSVLCDRLGMNPLVINGYSGSGVTQLEDSAHVNKVPMSSDARCSALNDGTTMPDVILIAGGVNDYTYAQSAQSEPLPWDGKTAPVIGNSFTEAYACMIKKLQTNYPNAIVVALSTWFTMRGTDNGYTLTHTVGSNTYTQTDYNNAIKNVCEQMHIPFIDVSDIGFNRNNFYPTYAEDSSSIPTHPNKVGQRVMGLAVAYKLAELVKAYLT